MTRLAFGLDGWDDPRLPRRGAADRGRDPARRRHVPERPAVGLPAARRHARPAPDGPPVLRLHRRRHRPLHDRRRRPPGDALGPRARPLEEPERDRLGQRADHLHPRHRRRDGPGQRGHARRASRGSSSATCRRSRSAGAPQITEPRIYFGERASPYVVVGAQAGRVRLPAGESDAAGGDVTTTLDRDDRDPARHDAVAAAVRAPLPRPQPADQRPDHDREPAAVPPLARRTGCRGSRRSCATTRTPTSSSTRRGRLVYIQDAYTTSDRFPHAQAFSPSDARSTTGLGDDVVQLHPQQRQDRHRRLRRDDDTSTSTTRRPDHPGLAGRLPDAVPADVASSRRTSGRTSASRRSCSTSRPGCSAATTSRTRSTFFRQDDLWTVPTGQTSEQSLPTEAYYVIMWLPEENQPGVPPPPADGPARAAEHDRLGRRPDGRRRPTARRASTASRPRRPSSGPAQIEAQIDRTR